MTPHSDFLRSLGRRILGAYARLDGVACTAVIGSSAEGRSDEFSDLDLAVYYHALPPEPAIQAVRPHVGGGPVTLHIGTHASGEYVEAYRVEGVDCQVGHTTIERWESDIRGVLDGKDIGSPINKALSGTLVAIAITGESLLRGWQDTIRVYPDALAHAAASHFLKFFAVWGVIDRLERRDAPLWLRQVLVDSSFNILGALAAVNRVYFTTFQFKRQAAFIDSLKIKPADLSCRLAELWTLPMPEAAIRLRSLVEDTVELIEEHAPQVDTSAARRALARKDGAWRLPNKV